METSQKFFDFKTCLILKQSKNIFQGLSLSPPVFKFHETDHF